MRILKAVSAATALLASFLASAAHAGTIRSDRDPQLYLNLGASSKYASVGRIDMNISTAGYIGSGTLIAPNWVLTAGHMVSAATKLTFTVGGASYTADKWLANPKWNGDLFGGYDIGLVHLSKAVTSVAPARRYTGQSELGAVDTIVGYGMTGTGLTGATTFDGKKRAGNNTIDLFYGSSTKTARIFLSDFDNPTNKRDNYSGSATPLNLEYMIAPGDSGGGDFIDIGGQSYLAGVNSFVAALDGKVDSDYGDVSGHIRVSAFNSWIDAIIAANSGPGGAGGKNLASNLLGMDYSPDEIAPMVPEPAAISVLALGGLMLVIRKEARRVTA